MANVLTASISRRLGAAAKKAGISDERLELLRQELTGEKRRVRVPRGVVRRLSEMLGQHGQAVIVLGRSGKLRVYSLNGHKSASESASANKPWLKGKKEVTTDEKKA